MGEKFDIDIFSWTEPETIIGTAAAMAGSVRLDRGSDKTLLGKGFGGVERDEYNVVFWKEEPK